jgi:hypothetical protein
VHDCIASGKEQGFVVFVGPTDEEGWLSALSVHLQDLSLLVGLSDMVALDDEMIARFGMHQNSLHAHQQGSVPVTVAHRGQ